MHGNLEPDEDVLDWDIEQIKKSYREGAKDYDRIMKEMEDEKKEKDKLTSQDLEWQEQRRKRKVRKLDFETR